MHTKYEVSISYGSKVLAKVKVDNRQTDKQTNRQDKNNMRPEKIWAHKKTSHAGKHLEFLWVIYVHVKCESHISSQSNVISKCNIFEK